MGFKARSRDTNCICNYTSDGTQVIDSRNAGRARRRRRLCDKCGRRFTTYEFELPRVDGHLHVHRHKNGFLKVSKFELVEMPVVMTKDAYTLALHGDEDG